MDSGSGNAVGFGRRSDHIRRLASEELDLLVVGGGITGAGIALDAAVRGLRVGLLDRADFAAGTSMRSTKLVHGGLRYLAQYEFGLTHEALTERAVLRALAPELVRWLPFVIPSYHSLFEFAKLFAGLWLYDALAIHRTPNRHQVLTRGRLLKLAPGLRREGLIAGYVYSDCGTDDVRLTLEVLRTAATRGVALANHAEVTAVTKSTDGKANGVAAVDRETGEEFTIRAKQVVLAGGVWADGLARLADPDAPRLVRPAKGVHLVVERERFGHDCALFLPTMLDDRLVFVIPWQGATLIGTTDTDYEGSLEAPEATAGDIAYLLGAINRVFPEAGLEPSDVVSVQAGLRPLVSAGDGSTSKLSRHDRIIERPSGVITVAGGKLTTYRKMAERVVDLAQRRQREAGSAVPASRCLTDQVPLGAFAPGPAVDSPALAALSDSTREHLRKSYGANAAAVAAVVAEQPGLGEGLLPERPWLKAEVVYAARHEMARSVADVLARRTHVVQLTRDQGRAISLEVARLLAAELGWSEERVASEVARFAAEVRQFDPRRAVAEA